MKEYIERAVALEALSKSGVTCNMRAHKIVASIQAADVVEVVRCQNCKYRIYKDMGDDIGMIGGCQVWGAALPGDFYCAHGVHMDKGDDNE